MERCHLSHSKTNVILLSGFFLNEMIRHHQLPVNLIFISERPGFGFYEAIFRLFRISEQNGRYIIVGEGLHFYMCKTFMQYKIIV
jgi:hypothetical protein